MSASDPIIRRDFDAWARRLYLDSRPDAIARSHRRSLLMMRLAALLVGSIGIVGAARLWSVHGPVAGALALWALPLVALAAVLVAERLVERR
jgi:hypothetical protein